MKKSIFFSTLIAATALAVPAFADGSGTQSDPYTGTCDGLDIFNSSTWPAGSTVYIDGITSGYFISGNDTCVADVNIGSNGMTFSNGYQAATYLFTGDISGTGNWTFSNNGTARQDCTFTGSLADYSGNISITSGSGTENEDYFRFGNGGQAATDTNVSGTGSITITSTSGLGEITFNYGSYASETSTAITIGNSSLTASEITFTGSVNYVVNSTISGNSGASSTLTISNTGYTTTLNGTVSGINVTVNSGATLAVGSTGTLDLSGATVDLASAIQNSGTVTIDTSTVFVLDNLTYDGTLTEGATYTLITGSSGSVTISGDLGTSNVSSTHEIESATFEYTDGVLTVTVVELADGRHGDGTEGNPYYTSGSGTISIPVSGDGSIFTGKGTTVYLATDEKSFGTASMQIYWGGAFTAECDIVIGAAGVYITDGSAGQSHKFTGAISGAGDFTVTHNGSQGQGVNQDYCFTGDLSQWSGNFTIDTTSTSDYVCYGDGATVATTATNVTGTGAVSVATGTIAFDYIKEGSDGNTGPSTITIGNSLLTAAKFEFVGDVNYIVSEGTTITSASSSGSFVVSTEGGTVTILGTLTTGNDNNAFSSLSVAEGSTLRIGADNTFYMDTTSTSGDVFVVSGTLEVAEGVSFTIRKRSAATGYSIANLSLENGSTLLLNTYGSNQPGSSGGLSIGTLTVTGSATLKTDSTGGTNHWQNSMNIAALVGKDATLNLTSDIASSVANIFELGTSGNTESTSQFTGKIVLSDSASGNRGLTLIVSEEKIAAGAVIEMGAEDSTDALALGVNADRVEIAGLVSGGSGNNGGDIVYSGYVSMGATLGNAGATLIDYKGQSGYGSGSNYDGVGTSRNTLVINVAENATYSFSGVIMDMLNLEKTGAGTQSIEFKLSSAGSTGYYFDGTIAVTEGTLNLSGVETNSSGITVAEGATLSISNHITLAATSDIGSVTSTISGTLSIESGGQLDLTGTVTINSAISNSGTITIANGTSITVGVTMQTGDYNGTNYDYYTLISGSGDGSVTLGDSVTFVIGDESITLSSIIQRYADSDSWNIYSEGGSLLIYAETSTTAQTADNLTWAGTDVAFTWNTSSENAIWNDTDTGTSGYYFTDGNNVTFGADGAYTTVAVEGEVTAGSTTINGAYTFAIGDGASVTTGALTISEGGSLTLTGSGTIVTGGESNSTLLAFDASNFTGEMDFTQGHLDIANSTFNEDATVVVTANTTASDDTTGVLTTTDVSLSLAGAEENSNSEFAASLVFAGDGGVIIRTNAASKTVTFSGSVTGESATLQLNGGGNAVFTNTVNVGKYTNYQGTTTFSGATTLGELTIYQPGDTDNGVTFTGSAAQATVTDITIHSSVGSVAATLTVSDGASLSVGTMTIDHDLAITIDSAAMSITTSVTQASGTYTSVTISNGGTLALGSDVSLNVDALEIILGTDTYTNGIYAITGGTDSLVVSEAAIKITVDEALASLLGEEGTYTFDIYSGLSLDEGVFDIDDILGYTENVSWNNGVLTVVVGSGAIPEPSMFGVIFGLGALGLVATRRRRRKAA